MYFMILLLGLFPQQHAEKMAPGTKPVLKAADNKSALDTELKHKIVLTEEQGKLAGKITFQKNGEWKFEFCHDANSDGPKRWETMLKERLSPEAITALNLALDKSKFAKLPKELGKNTNAHRYTLTFDDKTTCICTGMQTRTSEQRPHENIINYAVKRTYEVADKDGSTDQEKKKAGEDLIEYLRFSMLVHMIDTVTSQDK